MSEKLKVVGSGWTRPPSNIKQSRWKYRFRTARWQVQRWLLPALSLLLCYLYITVFPEPAAIARAPNPIRAPAQAPKVGSSPPAKGEPRLQVIDGDTIRLFGETIRIANIDTAEISEAKCDSELALGLEAKTVLTEILGGGQIDVSRGDPRSGRMTDSYGRTLALVLVNGSDVGETLIARNLARPWIGKRRPWC